MTLQVLFLAFLAAGGAFLVVDSFTGIVPRPRPRAAGGLEEASRLRKLAPDQDRITLLEKAPLLDRLLRPVLEDMARRQDPQKRERVELMLRRSGWKYKTPGDFYAARVLMAAMFFVGGAVFLIISGTKEMFWAPLLMGILGYFLPLQEVRSALKERERQVLTEMAFALERLAILLRSGLALHAAINVLAEAPGGPFMAALRNVGMEIVSGRVADLDEVLDEMERDLPDHHQIHLFINRLKLGFRGTPIAGSLSVQAGYLQGMLNSMILKRGLETVLIITTVGGAFMLPALGLIVMGPPLLMAFSIFR